MLASRISELLRADRGRHWFLGGVARDPQSDVSTAAPGYLPRSQCALGEEGHVLSAVFQLAVGLHQLMPQSTDSGLLADC